jgi:hypothetical protein
MTASITVERSAAVQYVLRLADACLILSHRLSEWCGHAPIVEEDIALANMALDLLGQSRALLTHAAALEGRGHDEDQLAFLRDERDFLNPTATSRCRPGCCCSGSGSQSRAIRSWRRSPRRPRRRRAITASTRPTG